MDRAAITISGTVQGVGFRGLVKSMADKLGLVGKVSNLEDMTVQVICEGRRDAIESLVNKIATLEDTVKVENVSVAYSAPTHEFGKFDVILGDTKTELVAGMVTLATYLGKISKTADKISRDTDKISRDTDKISKTADKISRDTDGISQNLASLRVEQRDGFRGVHERQDDLTSAVRDQTVTFREFVDARFDKLEAEIEKIKERMRV